jgi:hypothetical protein
VLRLKELTIPPVSPLHLHGVHSDSFYRFLLHAVIDWVVAVGHSNLLAAFLGFVFTLWISFTFLQRIWPLCRRGQQMDSWTFSRQCSAGNPLLINRRVTLTVATAGGLSGCIRCALMYLINIIHDDLERKWRPLCTILGTCPTTLLWHTHLWDYVSVLSRFQVLNKVT